MELDGPPVKLFSYKKSKQKFWELFTVSGGSPAGHVQVVIQERIGSKLLAGGQTNGTSCNNKNLFKTKPHRRIKDTYDFAATWPTSKWQCRWWKWWRCNSRVFWLESAGCSRERPRRCRRTDLSRRHVPSTSRFCGTHNGLRLARACCLLRWHRIDISGGWDFPGSCSPELRGRDTPLKMKRLFKTWRFYRVIFNCFYCFSLWTYELVFSG